MKNVIALDIGGTNVRAAIIDENFNILKVIRKSTLIGSVNLFLEQICSLIDELNPKESRCAAIVAGVPGRVRWDGFIDALPNIHIDNIPLRSFLEARYGVPVFVANDAEVAALAEAIAGAGKNLKSSYFVTISTGIGGALVVDKKLKKASYEIGHTLFPYRNEYYELEKIASGTGIEKLLQINGIKIAQTYQFFEKVSAHDPLIMGVYSDWLALLASFFRYIKTTFEPEMIILSGGVIKSASVFFTDLQKKIPDIPLAIAHYEQDAGLIGAACFAFSML